MKKTLTVIFDGQVLRPESQLELEPEKRYVITIDTEPEAIPQGDAWDVLEAFAGTVEAPSDWASKRDRFIVH
jgi:hypothetical protein